MANPNIVAVTTIKGNTAVQSVTTSATNIVDNPAGSGKIYKIGCLIVSNIDGVNASDITVDLYRNTTAYKIINTISVLADTSFTAIDKTLSLYLLEGDALRLTAGNNSRLQAVCSFEEIS
jgi:hypothetical protein